MYGVVRVVGRFGRKDSGLPYYSRQFGPAIDYISIRLRQRKLNQFRFNRGRIGRYCNGKYQFAFVLHSALVLFCRNGEGFFRLKRIRQQLL
jgi:hypothetical protein